MTNHAVLVEEGALQALFSLANSRDTLSQYYVAHSLANFACLPDNHARIVELGGLQPLISLAYSPDPDVHQQAAAALRGLAVNGGWVGGWMGGWGGAHLLASLTAAPARP